MGYVSNYREIEISPNATNKSFIEIANILNQYSLIVVGVDREFIIPQDYLRDEGAKKVLRSLSPPPNWRTQVPTKLQGVNSHYKC